MGGDHLDWVVRKGLFEEMRIIETRAYVTRSGWPSQGTGGSDQSKPPWRRSNLGDGAPLEAKQAWLPERQNSEPGSSVVNQSGWRCGGWEGGKARSPLGAA